MLLIACAKDAGIIVPRGGEWWENDKGTEEADRHEEREVRVRKNVCVREREREREKERELERERERESELLFTNPSARAGYDTRSIF